MNKRLVLALVGLLSSGTALSAGNDLSSIRLAVQNGDVKKVELLLAKDPKLVDDVYRGMPLIMRTKRIDVIKVLLAHHINLIYRINGRDFNAVDSAVDDGDVERLKLFAPTAETLNKETLGSRAALNLAVGTRKNRAEVVRYLLERGANPNGWVGKDIRSPLAAAVSQSDTDTVRILLDHGADINYQNGRAFFSAVGARNTLMMEFLLKNGAQIDPKERYAASPLLYIVSGPHMIDSAASSEDLKEHERNYFPIVKFLVEHGADVNIEDVDEQYSALGAAEHHGYKKISAYLRKHGAKTAKWNSNR